MKTVKKFTGELKHWNIRQLNNGYFQAYIGTVCQAGNFPTLKICEKWIRNPHKYL
jgi:hypothetical protein